MTKVLQPTCLAVFTVFALVGTVWSQPKTGDGPKKTTVDTAEVGERAVAQKRAGRRSGNASGEAAAGLGEDSSSRARGSAAGGGEALVPQDSGGEAAGTPDRRIRAGLNAGEDSQEAFGGGNESVNELRQRSYSKSMSVPAASLKAVADTVSKLIGNRVTVTIHPGGTLMLKGPRKDVAAVEKLIQQITDLNGASRKATAFKFFHLQQATLREAELILKELFSKDDVLFSADHRGNAVLARGNTAALREVESVILALEKAAAESARRRPAGGPTAGAAGGIGASVRPSGGGIGAPKRQRATKTPEGTGGFDATADTAIGGGMSMRMSGRVRAQDLARLRNDFAQADRRAESVAKGYSRLRSRSQREKKLNEVKQAVSKACRLRESLHSAEVAVLRQRLQAVESKLTRRRRLRNHIIDRRVRDLIEGEESKWETTSGVADAGGGQAKPDASARIELVEPGVVIIRGSKVSVDKIKRLFETRTNSQPTLPNEEGSSAAELPRGTSAFGGFESAPRTRKRNRTVPAADDAIESSARPRSRTSPNRPFRKNRSVPKDGTTTSGSLLPRGGKSSLSRPTTLDANRPSTRRSRSGKVKRRSPKLPAPKGADATATDDAATPKDAATTKDGTENRTSRGGKSRGDSTRPRRNHTDGSGFEEAKNSQDGSTLTKDANPNSNRKPVLTGESENGKADKILPARKRP